MLRGLGLVVGFIGGTQTTKFIKKLFNKNDDNRTTFIIGGILHLVAIIVNFIAFKQQTNFWFITATIFENLNKGYMMSALTKFFLFESHQKPHILTFFWGFFSLLRAIYGGISGYFVVTLGVDNFFYVLIGASILPIIIAYKMKNNTEVTSKN